MAPSLSNSLCCAYSPLSFFPPPPSSSSSSISASPTSSKIPKDPPHCSWIRPLLLLSSSSTVVGRGLTAPVCRAAEYKFPDPIPEFADAEIEKFEEHLFRKLSKKDIFGDSIPQVVGICTEILSTFLHSEYQGPGTLLVDPFIDIADTIKERGLPGGPQAARAAVKWAQKHVDKDWKEWTGFDL